MTLPPPADPFRAPAPAPTAAPLEGVEGLRGVIVRWELLRAPYNALLLVEGLVVLALLGDPVTLVLALDVLAVGLAANVAFTFGPVVEIYVLALRGHPTPGLRELLLVLGTALSLLVVASPLLLRWLA